MTLDVYSALFDSDLDAVAERLGKAAEDWLRTRSAKSHVWTPPKSAVTRESSLSSTRIATD